MAARTERSGALEADVEHLRHAPQQRERSAVVARRERGDLLIAGRARVAEQLGGEGRADASMLVRVGDGERDLGTVASLAHEPRDRNRDRIALDIGDECVASVVDGRELAQVGAREARLRAVEPRTPGRVAELLEDGQHRPNVPVRKRSHEDRRAVSGFERSRVHSELEKPTIGRLEKSTLSDTLRRP